MAYKQQVRNRGRVPKRRPVQMNKLKRRTGGQKAKQKLKVRGRNMKKPQSRLSRKAKSIPRAKAVKTPKLKLGSARYFVYKKLQEMPKVDMEPKARRLLRKLLMDVYNQVKTKFEGLSKEEIFSISCDNVQNSVMDAFAKELAKLLGDSIQANRTTLGEPSLASSTTSTTNATATSSD